MGAQVFVGEVARQLRCTPQEITLLFYRRFLDNARCPVISGRRLIPADYIPEIKRVVREQRQLRAARHPVLQESV